jgi:peptide chain release factor
MRVNSINKTNSAAQLTHIPTGIVVKSQATRSRSQNYTIARKLLAEKVEFLEKGDESRAAKVLARKAKKKASADKKKRRKYRELAAEKNGELVGVEDVDGNEDVEDELEDEEVGKPPSTGGPIEDQRGENGKFNNNA